MPLVSVVIATYRRPDMVRRSVASALGQTLRNLEVIVVVEQDDHETIPVLESFADKRVRFIVNPVKRGPGPARDTGARASTGVWVAFLDDDDEWMPEKLAKQIASVGESTTTISMTLSRVVMPGGSLIQPTSPYQNDQPIDEWLFGRQSWLKGGESFLQTSSLMVPRRFFEKLQFGNPRHEEWEFVIRAIKQFGFSLETVHEPLVTYYTGNIYPLEGSLLWVDSVRDLLTRQAYSGFCLTVATHHVGLSDRNSAFFTLLKMALRDGTPTLRQLFAFGLLWLIPYESRKKIRLLLGNSGD
jgi:glycosyltransferase involved in cell wall biosynthesis